MLNCSDCGKVIDSGDKFVRLERADRTKREMTISCFPFRKDEPGLKVRTMSPKLAAQIEEYEK